MADEAAFVEVQVETVGRTAPDHWVVQLTDATDRKLPNHIGQCEAMAIAQRNMPGFDPQRPLTQDLALALWRRLGGELVQLRIDDLLEGIYYSKLTVKQHGEAVEIDCRPSDGLALALTASVPIYVADTVMHRGGKDDPAEPPDTFDRLLLELGEDAGEDAGEDEAPDQDQEDPS